MNFVCILSNELRNFFLGFTHHILDFQIFLIAAHLSKEVLVQFEWFLFFLWHLVKIGVCQQKSNLIGSIEKR